MSAIRFTTTLYRRTAALAPVMFTFLLGPQAAAGPLEDQVSRLATQIAAVCQEDGYGSVRIKFDEPRSTRQNGSPLPVGTAAQVMSTLLAERLHSDHNVPVKKLGGDIRLQGEIIIDEFGDDGAGSAVTGIAIDVKINFIGRNGKPLLNVREPKVAIEDSETIARLLGIPFDEFRSSRSGSTQPAPHQAEPVVEGLLKPQQPDPGMSGGVIRGRQDGAFGIRILTGGSVSADGRLVGARSSAGELEDGMAIVELGRGDEFSVEIINDADFEVAVQLNLDGVDSFHFRKNKGFWLVPNKQSITINGWQIDNGSAKRFTVFPYEKSIAAELGFVDSVGVIQAIFHRTWHPGEQPPPGEHGVARPADGVGAGRDINSRVKNVNRNVGRARASIPVRYVRPD